MDHPWNNARRAFTHVLALGFLVTGANAQLPALRHYALKSTASAPQAYVSRKAVVTYPPNSGLRTSYNTILDGGTRPSSGLYTFQAQSNYAPAWSLLTWDGNTVSSSGITATNVPISIKIYYQFTPSGSVRSFDIPVPASSFPVTFDGAIGGILRVFVEDFKVTLSPTEDPIFGDPPPEKIYHEGVLFFDNLTGSDQIVKIGNEEIVLKPGYNSFPFYGEVDESGMPKGLPVGTFGLVEGPDGMPIFTGRMVRDIEGVPTWGDPPSPVYPLASSNGTTIKLPNGVTSGVTDYVALPPGMTAGNNVPVPPGVNGTPPSGVTPGPSGSLNNGVISGGTAYLPPNVSAGTVQGNAPGGVVSGGSTPTGGATSGGGVQSGTGQQGADGNYVPGSSMAGIDEAARAEGKAAAQGLVNEAQAGVASVNTNADGILSTDWGFWTAPGESGLSSRDDSWLAFTLPIGDGEYDFAANPEHVSLLREILLWVVKIFFVVAILKLFFR